MSVEACMLPACMLLACTHPMHHPHKCAGRQDSPRDGQTRLTLPLQASSAGRAGPAPGHPRQRPRGCRTQMLVISSASSSSSAVWADLHGSRNSKRSAMQGDASVLSRTSDNDCRLVRTQSNYDLESFAFIDLHGFSTQHIPSCAARPAEYCLFIKYSSDWERLK